MQTLSQLRNGDLVGSTRLTLSENLTSFPLEVLTLADSLEILDLSNNQLTFLPKELAQLTKLKVIFASNNLFTSLPEVLSKCESLEMVGFKANKISTVPANALPLKLRWLILTDNRIELLPDTLGERPKLQKLALAGNKLTELPLTMAKLNNLELVRISANQLTQCPTQLLQLPKLAWFAFSGNPFSCLDHTINAASPVSVPLIPSSSYILQEVLGQGASGVISRAIWTTKQSRFPDEVAVKVFKGEITSDGYPEDELQACLKTGNHKNIVRSLAQVKEKAYLALIMDLIPEHYANLGLPPSFKSCTRDTFPSDFTLSIGHIDKIVTQMEDVFEHLHANQVCHGDLYAHNTLFDKEANIIFGDFGAASMYHMLTSEQQIQIKAIEKRAFKYFIDDLLSICTKKDQNSVQFKKLLHKLKTD
jgi:hypothetical protein